MAKQEEKKEKTAEDKSLSVEVIEQMSKLATAGFGLVAALAWNDAVQTFFNDYLSKLPGANSLSPLFYKLYYAIIITLIVVLITYYLSRVANRIQNKKK